LAIPNIINWLKDTGDYQDSYTYTTIKSYISDEDQAKSFALRLLIHYLGDIHQPLHCTELVDDKYPSGDRGGNSIKIPTKDEADNLHAVWDAVLYADATDPTLPLGSDDWSSLGDQSSSLESTYQVDPDEVNNENVNQWAYESYTLATADTYPDVEEYDSLTDDYVTKNKKVAENQLVLGGNRLAYVISDIFGSS